MPAADEHSPGCSPAGRSRKSGRAITEAILNGERDAAATLTSLADARVKKSLAELSVLPEGQHRMSYSCELKDYYELMQIYEQCIGGCDVQISLEKCCGICARS